MKLPWIISVRPCSLKCCQAVGYGEVIASFASKDSRDDPKPVIWPHCFQGQVVDECSVCELMADSKPRWPHLLRLLGCSLPTEAARQVNDYRLAASHNGQDARRFNGTGVCLEAGLFSELTDGGVKWSLPRLEFAAKSIEIIDAMPTLFHAE